MCSINGLISFNDHITMSIVEYIKDTIISSESRGKDSFGYCTINDNKEITTYKYIAKPSDVISSEFIVPVNAKIILNNNRAEPTTEYVKNKSKNDIQPFQSEHCIVVHNGTIANDKEIIKKYNLDLNTTIDSAVIPYLFDSIDKYDYTKAIQVLTEELIGSYSLAVYNNKTEVLYLANNYKPLYIAYDEDQNVIYFSSFEEYMTNVNNYNSLFDGIKYKQVQPYTLLVIHKGVKSILSFSLYKEQKNVKKKALIIASAGLDSTVAASWAQYQKYDVTLLHFNYKCRADKKERDHIKLIADYLHAPLVNIDIPFLADVIGNSNLFDGEITHSNNGSDGAELAIEWVPARNLLFMSIAAAYAEAHKFDYIILGGNLEESGAYADNELIFQKKFNEILPHALNLNNRVQVLMPIANMMKKDIIELGLKLNSPLHLTWSCYENGELACGTCGPCFMRKTAFKMLGVEEVIKYANDIIEGE